MNKNEKINLVKYWRYMFLGYMMLAWIVLVFFMDKSEWTLIPAFFAYLCSITVLS